jgi:hypothetical protein
MTSKAYNLFVFLASEESRPSARGNFMRKIIILIFYS